MRLLQVVGGVQEVEEEDFGWEGDPRGCKSGGSNRIGRSQKSRRNGRHISHLAHPSGHPHSLFTLSHTSSGSRGIVVLSSRFLYFSLLHPLLCCFLICDSSTLRKTLKQDTLMLVEPQTVSPYPL